MSQNQTHNDESQPLRVGLAQIAPAFLQREATLERVCTAIEKSAKQGCGLVVFPEAIVPGYPFWICRTDGAQFDNAVQKTFYARYLDQAVDCAGTHLDGVRRLAKSANIAVVLGVVERPADRGGHSLYCSRVWIDANGEILSIHRKLMPTYEERLVWANGDGHGLQVHPVGGFCGGALNCWENWMPLARAALYGQGENLHISIWPGRLENTADITRFIAREGRCYSVAVSGLLRAEDLPADLPLRDKLAQQAIIHNGGSAVANPDGTWLIEPVIDQEIILVAELFRHRVYEERQNFDPSGHYSRADVLQLTVQRTRQSTLQLRPEQ